MVLKALFNLPIFFLYKILIRKNLFQGNCLFNRLKMNKKMALQRYFLSIFIIFLGFLSLQINADGIASVNSYVEIKSSATDFRARKQSNNGQRSTSGFDFIITPERTNICQGLSNSICNSTYNFSGLGYVPTGSATSIVFADTLANSYLVFINDNHNSRDDRTSMIGQIVFDYEILGYWTDPSMTVDFDYVDKVGATYQLQAIVVYLQADRRPCSLRQQYNQFYNIWGLGVYWLRQKNIKIWI